MSCGHTFAFSGSVVPLSSYAWGRCDGGATSCTFADASGGSASLRLRPCASCPRPSWRPARALGFSSRLMRTSVLLCWLGAPIEDLMSELQWLYDGGKVLFDVQIPGSSLNPFRKARRRLCVLLPHGRVGPLQPPFDEVLADQHPELLHKRGPWDGSSQLRLFSAETKWRFALYFEYPYAFSYLVHLNATDAEKDIRMKHFSAREMCCHDVEFSRKVRQKNPTWRSLKACNMWSERLLARFRSSIRGPDVDVERLVSISFKIRY